MTSFPTQHRFVGNLPQWRTPEKLHFPVWPPDSNLPNYFGPYPRNQLEDARYCLIQSLKYDQCTILNQVKPKLGIASCFGPASPPLPLPRLSSPGELRNSFAAHNETTGNQVHMNSVLNACTDVSRTSVDSGFADGVSLRENLEYSSILKNDQASFCSPFPSRLPSSTPLVRTCTITSPNQQEPSKNPAPLQPKFALKRSFSSSTNDSLDNTSKKGRFESDSKTPVELFVTYKCDLCSFKSTIDEDMKEHLVRCNHSSGSLYKTDGKSLISIQQMKAVENKFAVSKVLVVACPDCHEVFNDIFTCGIHHKYFHGSTHGQYAVCPITNQETITFPAEAKCMKCSAQFNSQKALHAHWKENDGHYPVSKASDKSFTLYSCPYCLKLFYENFISCRMHVLSHEKDTAYAVLVKQILVPKHSFQLPPFDSSRQMDGLEYEYACLRQLKQFYKKEIDYNFGCGCQVEKLRDCHAQCEHLVLMLIFLECII